MRKQLSGVLKEYKLAIIIALIVALVGSILAKIYIEFNSNKIKEFRNEYYSFNYNNSWKVKDKKENSILLIHNKEAALDVEIVSLEDEYRYLAIDDLLDELLFNIENQNEEYNLLFKESAYITKNNYEGCKMLYENGESQVMVVVCKKADKLFVFKYEATNNYFDILLDSVQNIIYTFDSIDEQFELSYKLAVSTSDITWDTNEEITSQLKDTKNYEIAYKNYLVNFSVPLNFELSDFNSTSNYFNYRGLSNGSMTLYANIYNQNIYEYLYKNGSYGTLYYSYNNIREGNGYSNFQENIKQMELEDRIGYLYKNSYTYTGYYDDTDYEEVILIYELDKSHIFTIELKASETAIPKELVSKIKINSSKNYASYINNKVENDDLICELKEFIDYDKSIIQVITLKFPQKYREIDKGYNIYTHRNYGLYYDEEMEIFEYDIEYEVYSSMDSKLNILNSDYSSHSNKGTYKELEYKETLTLNGKSFDVYEGGYTDISGALFPEKGKETYYVKSKVLFYKLDTGKILSIEIKGNDVEISNEILNELTNFDIEIKNK